MLDIKGLRCSGTFNLGIFRSNDKFIKPVRFGPEFYSFYFITVHFSRF